MHTPTVYFTPVEHDQPASWSQKAASLLRLLVKESPLIDNELYIKVHSGQPGNVTFVRPEHYNACIDFLEEQKITPSFVETGMVTGPRSVGRTHREIAQTHGFTRIPFVIADGETGEDHTEVSLPDGLIFNSAKIARLLAAKEQVLVMSHFKGHIDAGFGGALKMLGIGFASRIGKIEQHSAVYTPEQKTINWAEGDKLFHGEPFEKRFATYALAASKEKRHLYITYAVNLTTDCDCDGHKMNPIYSDLGIFASTDPVAIDKACFDLLAKREGKEPFKGATIFAFAQSIGIGSADYELTTV